MAGKTVRLEREIQRYLRGSCDLPSLRGKLIAANHSSGVTPGSGPGSGAVADLGSPTFPTTPATISLLTVVTLNFVAVQCLTSSRPIEVLRILLGDLGISARKGENDVSPLDLFLTAVLRDRLYIPLVVELRDCKFVVEIVELLVQRGAGREEREREHVLRKAVEFGHAPLVAYLREEFLCLDLNTAVLKSPPMGSPLHDAVRVLSYHAVESLLDDGANIEVRDPAGLTPLHVAAKFGCGMLIRLLLEKGADPNSLTKNDTNITTRDGANALHLYLWQKHHDVATVDFMLKRGVSLSAVCEGNTPLDCFADTRKAQKFESATMEADYVNADVLRCLLDAGAKGLCHKAWPQIFQASPPPSKKPIASVSGLTTRDVVEWEVAADRETRRQYLRELRKKDETMWEEAMMREMQREIAKEKRHRKILRDILGTNLGGRHIIYVKCSRAFYPFTYGMLLEGTRIMFPHENKKKSIRQENNTWVMHNGNRYIKDDQKDPGFMKYVEYAKF
ncbi:hypothetical protein ONS95_011604 [Cadophora gregata]|uniref:uncharacterized protein n=1 Tax=Cadophora gregata TaxID=51156 RepID=UPI0026DB0C2C|nr:uncharacterized protein ONS95_011604 [Cadophora gregata]KAK0120198.1 hypothetical protein ONS95_011604 [Cadophora gregata]KAK0121230.1 hypothetical protein ONS96_011407 [Cadophora gregata f. sp. sojae]